MRRADHIVNRVQRRIGRDRFRVVDIEDQGCVGMGTGKAGSSEGVEDKPARSVEHDDIVFELIEEWAIEKMVVARASIDMNRDDIAGLGQLGQRGGGASMPIGFGNIAQVVIDDFHAQSLGNAPQGRADLPEPDDAQAGADAGSWGDGRLAQRVPMGVVDRAIGWRNRANRSACSEHHGEDILDDG